MHAEKWTGQGRQNPRRTDPYPLPTAHCIILHLDHPFQSEDNCPFPPDHVSLDSLEILEGCEVMKPARIACVMLTLAASIFGQSSPANQIGKSPSTTLFSPSLRETSSNRSTARQATAGQPVSSLASGLNFTGPRYFDSGGLNTYAVAVADLNGDGKLDAVALSECFSFGSCAPQGVAVMLGNDDGTFQSPVNYPSGGSTSLDSSGSVAILDLNGDNKPDIVAANYESNTVAVLLGNGDGTFQPAVVYGGGGSGPHGPDWVALADLNRDGKPDIVVSNPDSNNLGVLLGNGDGTFQNAITYDSGGHAASVVVADLNADGKLDLVAANGDNLGVLLGNGDGTFQPVVAYAAPGGVVALADMNADGKPDLVTNGVAVLLGNGDGTFQAAIPYGQGGNAIAVADVNGDGKLDVLVTNSCINTCGKKPGGAVSVLLGNGDGTFQPEVVYISGFQSDAVTVADLNHDGKPDLIVADACSEFTCTGDGAVVVFLNASVSGTSTALASSLNPSNFGQTVTLTATLTAQPGFYKGKPTGTVNFFDNATGINLGTVALNSNGVATLQTSTLGPSTHSIVATYSGDTNFGSSASTTLSQIVLGAAAKLSPSSLVFADQTVGTTSLRQSIKLKNTGDTPLTFTYIMFTGANATSFHQVNNCGASLAGGATCMISVAFRPVVAGAASAALTLSDNAPSKLQKVPVSGVGVLPAVIFSPTSLTFPLQVIYTTSKAQTVTLTNSGAGILKIANIAASAQFSQTNNCGATVPPAGHCTLTVKFQPTALDTIPGSISVTDNAAASPQSLPLTGVATAIQLSPISVSFGNQPVGTKSLAKTVTVSNKSHQSVNISGVAIHGANPSDFPFISTTCGASLSSGASCFVKVAFLPTVTGKRTATVAVSDDGGGEIQRAALSGNGT